MEKKAGKIKRKGIMKLFLVLLSIFVVATLVFWNITLPTAKPQLLIVKGTVTDSNTGNPIEGVVVFADPMQLPFVTGENGSYRILVKSGTYKLNTSAEGFEDHNESVTVYDGDLTVNVSLKPVGSATTSGCAIVTGKVVNSKTRLPIGGTLVKADTLAVVTGQDGSYSLDVPKGYYTLTVKKEGFKEATVSVEVSEEKTYSVDVLLLPIPFITVTTEPIQIYTKNIPIVTINALVKNSEGSPVVGVKVNFNSSNPLRGYDDIGKINSVTAITNNAGVATVRWICQVDLSKVLSCMRGGIRIDILASANIEDQLVIDKYILSVFFAPCSDCHYFA